MQNQQSAQLISARTKKSSGSVLLLVLVVIAVITLGTFSYSVLMQNEYRAARFAGQRQQAFALAESGVAYLQAVLALDDDQIEEQGGLTDNPDLMQGLLVIEDSSPDYRGRFTVLAPKMDQGQWIGSEYGLENESAKLNLNTLLQQESRAAGSPGQTNDNTPLDRLMALPGMDETVAAAILDWLDQDNEPRENGAEEAYYQQLDPPYKPANGPLAHLDQLLAVRGVTPLLLYGLDTNRNYEVDSHESLLSSLLDSDNADGALDRGWASYLTITSAERVVNPDGDAKININSDDLQQLKNQLAKVITDDQATYIIAARQYGPEASGPVAQGSAASRSTGNRPAGGQAANGSNQPAGQVVDASAVTIDYKKKGEHKFGSLFDLVGVRVKIEGAEGATPQILESPWPDRPGTYRDEWLELASHVTAHNASQLAGRININLAPQVVLETITQFSDSAIDQILSARDSNADDGTNDENNPHRDISWLLAEGIVSLAEMKQIAHLITTHGSIYRGQVVGYFESGSPIARLEVVFDRLDGKPRLIDWHDLSMLGPGFTAELLGIEQ